MQMAGILRIIQGIISVYMLLIFIRVLLTWFQGPSLGRPFEILSSITDPYINYFRRLKFARIGNMDFSPIIAVMVLIILLQIISSLYMFGKITLGIVLGIIVMAIWSSISWILSFFIILIVIRLMAQLFRFDAVSPLLRTVDIIIHPLLEFLQTKLLKGRIISFQNGLLISGGGLFVIAIGGNYLFNNIIVELLYSLPI